MSIFFKKVSHLFLLAILCCGVMFCPKVLAVKTDIKKLVLDTKEQRELQFVNIRRLVKQAREASYKGEYPEASDFYQKADKLLNAMSGELAEFKNRSLTKEIKRFKSSWALFLMKKARRARLQKKLEDAINFAAEATLIDNKKNAEVSSFIESCKKENTFKNFPHFRIFSVFVKNFSFSI